MSYIDDLKKAANKLSDLASNPEASAKELHEAIFAAKRTLEGLRVDHLFLKDLKRLEASAMQKPPQYHEILGSYASFLAFFEKEQDLFRKEQLSPDTMYGLMAESETLWKAMQGEHISEQEVLTAIDNLVKQLGKASESFANRASDMEAALRGSQGLCAASTIAINIKFFPAEFAIPGGSLIASGTLGLWLLKDATNEKPIFKRLKKFFGTHKG